MSNRFKDNNYIHYSNCFEDADTLLRVIGKDAKTALSIASAGDNCLALLSSGLDKLVVFDRDPIQLSLTKLKFAAYKALDYDELLVFLGIVDGSPADYSESVFAATDEKTAAYFRANIGLITDIKLIHAGRFESYFQKFRKYILRFTQSQKNVDAFMNLPDASMQREFYDKNINNRRWRFTIKRFFSNKTVEKLGRDKAFFKYADGDLAAHIIGRFLQCQDHVLNKENPYLQYAVYNKFTALPRYLDKNLFGRIKSNLDRAVFVEGTLDDVAAPGSKFDFFNLSDIFEYMSEDETAKSERMISGMATKTAKAVFWNMLADRRFTGNDFIETDSRELFLQEKAYFYQALRVYEKKGD